MRFSALHLLLCLFLPLRLFAAPSSSDTHSLTTSDSSSKPESSSTHRLVSTETTKSHSLHIIHGTDVGKFPTHTFSPSSGTGAPSPDDRPQHKHAHDRQKPVIIFLEVLGGTFAFLLLIGILRCIISYRNTPNRDRIAAYIHRHQLQREMEEMEQAPPRHRSSLAEPPPPPYIPRPPAYGYDDVSTPLNTAYDLSSPPSPTAARHPDTPALPNG